jgi:DNA-binding NtrC family response regulator
MCPNEGNMPARTGSTHRILVVDDEEAVRTTLSEMLSAGGYGCTAISGGRDALRALRSGGFDVVITDVRLPDMSGLDLLSIIRDKYPSIPVIVITGFASVESTIGAMRRGAVDYIPKPFTRDAVVASVELALQSGAPRGRTLAGSISEIVYRSAEMGAVVDLVRRVSRTDSTILVTGESGTGKELVARAIHRMSARADQPFVTVNSGALPEGLLESELFGHVRGAFTGAVSVSVGRFRAADGGSLFLDEVGNMSPSMQVKMLRVLQEREITPVGSSEPVRVDVRLIAATNRNLEEAVRREEFREDLYYRMNVIEIHIPPLRARREDIIPLAQHFLERLSADAHVDLWKLAPDAQAALLSYGWPGNVRELENVIERATVLSEGSDITAAELPPRVGGVQENLTLPAGGLDEGFSLPEVINSVEKFYIQSALRKSGGNRSRAAGMLGMKRTTLLARMKSLGLGEEPQTGEN